MNDNEINVLIGNNLKRMMKDKNITQEELAKIVGTSQNMISRYINGKDTMGVMMSRKISKALRCSMDDFFEGVID